MNEKLTAGTPQGLTVGDIWFVLFRHKWKILIISALGLVAAAVQYTHMPKTFESQAKLFVKYVVETRSPSQIGANSGINNVDEGEAAINTELEILTSLDLAKRVAAGLAAEKRSLLTGGNTNDMAAAMVIQEGLRPELPNRGKVIQVGFRHSEKEVVQTVLEGVIREYKNMHESTHRPKSELEADLRSQLDQLKSSLNESEERLRQAKTNVGIVSLEESKKQNYEQMSKIRQQISDAEADLAGRKSLLSQFATILNVAFRLRDQHHGPHERSGGAKLEGGGVSAALLGPGYIEEQGAGFVVPIHDQQLAGQDGPGPDWGRTRR